MTIKATNSIIIAKAIKSVFEFISNLENDKLWRKEINNTTMSSKPQINALAIENSFLSKRVPNHILQLKCTEFSENKQVIYQTLPDSPFFLKSDRRVEFISFNETKVIYGIEFDKNIVRHGLGFTLPTFIINWVTKTDMQKYLTKLKAVIEGTES
ncbi:hypothetical protein GCM10011514_51130 [Emticicia aquatilis]|uniref:Uncharacterized protein n=1 Tax=Emticicia aquatilis TaxID=1537369 RepID=A0A916Z8M6_9BACT|nr:hypothetical protein [Emticicia aquatilis]GGD80775.1 hypothetical protein GCM10011514_51130 [Emticicia aquatilis]